MIYCYGICIEELLSLFSFLPLRAIFSCYDAFVKRRFSKQFYMDWLKMFALILNVLLIVNYFDYTSIYHTIRSDSVLKLTVIYSFARMFERYLCNVGHDAFDHMILVHEQEEKVEQVAEVKTLNEQPLPASLVKKNVLFLVSFAVHTVYLLLHAVLQLVKCASLNLAFNSNEMSGMALMTLIVANNYIELKTNIMKKATLENLFQMFCNDVNERFQFCMYAITIAVITTSNTSTNHTFVTVSWPKFIVCYCYFSTN